MSVLYPALFLVIGLAAGLLHFGLLSRNAALFARGGAAARALGMQVARLAITALILAGAARLGAASLLACAAGIFVARHFVLRRLGRVGR